MMSFKFSNEEKGINLLLLGAHSDDIEIGCGGTLLKLIADHKINHVKWIVFSSNQERAQEAMHSAEFFLQGVESREILIKDFNDGFFPAKFSDLKGVFEEVKNDFNPDLIFTHCGDDLHQDHRLLSQLTWNTFRDNLILEYEILKYDDDFGKPTFFVSLPEKIVKKKVEALLKFFLSQRNKHWFDERTFLSIMRLRGVHSACEYAEAFHCRKLRYY